MKIEESGWATIDSAPRDGTEVIVWGGLRATVPGGRPFAALAHHNNVEGWVARIFPGSNDRIYLNPTHWLPQGPPTD
jgi:hypothetical protein